MMEIENVRHSLAHLLASAVQELFPGVKLGMGPAIENGFYYDFDFGKGEVSKITTGDLMRIEKHMRQLISQHVTFKKRMVTKDEAKNIFKNQPYKQELIAEIPESKLSIYESGKFIDLCRGPHIKSTDQINADAFALERIAGAYWKGSEKNPMLTRIYGLAFATKKELEEYLKLQKEAEQKDHRVLGEKMELFMVDEKIGKGLPFWLPNGYFIRKLLEDYMYALEKENGYLHVLTPILAKEDLYKTSGHLAHYKDDMYSPLDIDGEKFYLKPMNCPHHHSIYNYRPKSYKDLPLRLAEFGLVHRYERSGVLTGLIRMRGFTQNDAHLYTTQKDLQKELIGVLKLFKKAYRDFQIKDFWFRVSLPDFGNKEKYGDVENKHMWQEAADALKNALKSQKMKFVEAIGEATFYGPKIDIQIKNIWGKEDSIATVQVDYYSARKFNLFYIDKNGKKQPPVIIHRAIFGSFERFFAFLLEKTAGILPTWLAPIQTVIIPIGKKHKTYAKKINQELLKAGFRSKLWDTDTTLGKRIRQAEMQKIPYMIVAGDQEVKSKSLNVRGQKTKRQKTMTLKQIIVMLQKETLLKK